MEKAIERADDSSNGETVICDVFRVISTDCRLLQIAILFTKG